MQVLAGSVSDAWSMLTVTCLKRPHCHCCISEHPIRHNKRNSPPEPRLPPMLALDARHVSRRVNRHSRSPASTTATCAAARSSKKKVGVQSRTGTGSLAGVCSKTYAAASAACFRSSAHRHAAGAQQGHDLKQCRRIPTRASSLHTEATASMYSKPLPLT